MSIQVKTIDEKKIIADLKVAGMHEAITYIKALKRALAMSQETTRRAIDKLRSNEPLIGPRNEDC